MIPRFKPFIGFREIGAALLPQFNKCQKFERKFSQLFETKDAVAFSYGRTALWAFFKALDIKDAEVVVTSYTCSVVAHAIVLSGNIPRFVDIDLDDFNMNLDLMEASITAQTRVVILTHLFGYPSDIQRCEEIVRLAEKKFGHKIWIIQDCAHSFGARWKNRMVTTSGDAAIFGLNISKTITSIFGGMITFNDQETANSVRSWREQNCHSKGIFQNFLRRVYLIAAYISLQNIIYGFTWWLQEKTPLLNKLTKSYHLDDQIIFPPDYLQKMSDIEAAIGLIQLDKYNQVMDQRIEIAQFYDRNLKALPNWKKPPIVKGATYSHYVIQADRRETLISLLAQKGIQLGELIQYNVASLKSYEKYRANTPNAEKASRTTVNIPISLGNPDKEMKKIVEMVNQLDNIVD